MIVAVLACLACAGLSRGAIVYVDQNVIGGANDGTTWPNAYTTLANALAHVSDGDQVWVAQGVYMEGAQQTIANASLTIYGGFASGATDVSQRDAAAHPVIVDGNNAYRCFSNGTANVTLDGLTIQRGRIGANGAGIYNAGSGLIVQNCVISNCITTADNCSGGGIYSSQPMQVLGCMVVSNLATTSGNGHGGGGIYFDSAGTLLVSNTVFHGNMAQDSSAGDSSYGSGGAIAMPQAGQLNAFNCVFDSNGALHYNSGELFKTRRGGAIYLQNNSAVGTVINCTFYGNYVVWGYGGGIYSAGAPLYITNCIFWANTNNYNGRQIYSESSTLSIGYGCFSGTTTNDIYAGGTLSLNNVITSNPRFANAAGHDFHLQSRGGRWTSAGWVTDAVTSPCIDAGDPASAYGNEPVFNGGRINLGFEGNTAQASKTPADTAINNNGGVTYIPGQTVATLNGVLTSTGAAPAEVWVYWGTVDGTNNATGQWANTNYFGTNSATLPAALITNVTVNTYTTYYYTFKSANAYGTNWATPSVSFYTIGTPPVMTIQATTPNAAELGYVPGVFTVFGDANMNTNLPLTVYYNIGGTAINGADYATIPSSVTIPAGSTNATITVTPLYDTLAEGDETVILGLASNLLYTIGSPSNATVTIADNPSAGVVVYLDPNVVGGCNDGTSWANACSNLASAVAHVAPGGAIWVVKGSYIVSAPIVIAATNVTVYGGFTNGMTLSSQRNTAANAVIIDGNLASQCLNITAANVTLDGLTIQRGRIDGNGAGIYNTGTGLTIQGCIISNCVTTADSTSGGGIYSTQPMQILNSLVVNNLSSTTGNGSGAGGVMFTSTGTLLVSNTVFQGNMAKDANAGDSTSYGAGGAIHMYNAGQLNAFNCIFDGNGSLHYEDPSYNKSRRGGAIYLRASSGGGGLMVNCTFAGNYVVQGYGGAVYSAGAPLYITNSIFWANTDSFFGQQIY
jgi:hypothetical protein